MHSGMWFQFLVHIDLDLEISLWVYKNKIDSFLLHESENVLQVMR